MHLLGAYGVGGISTQYSDHPWASNCFCKFEYTADAILPVNGNGEGGRLGAMRRGGRP